MSSNTSTSGLPRRHRLDAASARPRRTPRACAGGRRSRRRPARPGASMPSRRPISAASRSRARPARRSRRRRSSSTSARELLPRLARRVAVDDPALGAHDLAERPVDDSRAVRQAAALADGGRAGRARRAARSSSRSSRDLPTPAWPTTRHQVRAALAHDALVERLEQRRARRRGPRAAPRCGRRHAPHGLLGDQRRPPPRPARGSALPFSVERLERRVLDRRRGGAAWSARRP